MPLGDAGAAPECRVRPITVRYARLVSRNAVSIVCFYVVMALAVCGIVLKYDLHRFSKETQFDWTVTDDGMEPNPPEL